MLGLMQFLAMGVVREQSTKFKTQPSVKNSISFRMHVS